MTSPPPPPGGLPRPTLTVEQQIRALAAAAAYPPYGHRSRIDTIAEIAAYIRDGSTREAS